MILWGINESRDDHPLRVRLGCLEIVGLVVIVVLGWVMALWIDSVIQETKALQPARQEVAR